MWVEELPQGKFRYAERYLDPLTGKQKKVSVTLEKNSKQAYKQAAGILAQKIDAKLLPSEKKITLTEVIELYREEQKKTVKASTWKRNYFACETMKKILGPDTLLASLTAGYIRKAYLATGKTPGTMNENISRLKTLIRWAYRNEYIASTECIDKLERFKDIPHAQKIEDKFLEATEVAKLLAAMKVKKWKDLTEFLVLSGLRFGEAAALQRTDLDMKNRIIKVNKTFDSVNNIVTSPKTRTSIRDVYMQDQLFALCQRLLSQSYISAEIIKTNQENRLFGPQKKKCIDIYVYSCYFKDCAERALGRKITPHILRHTHASLMLEKGIGIDAISNRLGHANSNVTREIYLHVTKKLQEERNAQIKELNIFAP
ncbi:MAG: tyrosine-type recombinase/integrase [Lacrimispora saccharolytica]|mgnify:FL=1